MPTKEVYIVCADYEIGRVGLLTEANANLNLTDRHLVCGQCPVWHPRLELVQLLYANKLLSSLQKGYEAHCQEHHTGGRRHDRQS